MRHRTIAVASVVVIATLAGRAGGPEPVGAAADPCAAATSAAQHRAPAERAPIPTSPRKAEGREHDDRWNHLDRLWAHRAALARGLVRPMSTAAASADVGDVAVLVDGGDLVISPNAFDLAGAALRFVPNASGGYDVVRRPLEFRTASGSALVLGDDDTGQIALPFAFAFYGRQYDQVFVNSDGNLTFEEGDNASTARSVGRLLSGPPRIAPFLADLDPSRGGRVVATAEEGAFTLTWCGVNGFDSDLTATVQAVLLPDGAIEMQIGEQTTLGEAVVALSPGHTDGFAPVDLSAPGPIPGGSAAVGERFAEESELDTVAVARRFLATHPDEFDNVVIFTDTRLLRGAFAVQIPARNQIRGLKLPIFDFSREHGSAGRLESVVYMDYLAKYPDDPRARFRGENSTLSIMGQEVGHRWLAFLEFRDHTGQPSQALLGRDHAHWSFFFDSDASVVEGNDIEDLGDGSFRTVAAVERYSLLDQYAMGVVDPFQVPPFFYVENPTDVDPPREADSAPRRGVTFRGTRRDVRIEDVIAVVGRREPTSAQTSREYRQAFIYVVSAGREAEQAAIGKLDRIRLEWEQFFSRATDSRMRAVTRLGP